MGFWEKIDKTGERIDIYEKIKKDTVRVSFFISICYIAQSSIL